VPPTHKSLTAHFPCLLHALQIKGGDAKLVILIQTYVWLLITFVAYSDFIFQLILSTVVSVVCILKA